VTFDQDFDGVVQGCAEREETWISGPIARVYGELHRLGHAHSCEVWDDEALVGGVYGVALGAAFFGESMFSRRTDASKVALFHLLGRLRAGGFTLFDTQFLTPHLASLGGEDVSRATYRLLLEAALQGAGRWEGVA
jgi:leucyl/phenylalanyl-tRNA--protein transferase